jgi:hypothetical protein
MGTRFDEHPILGTTERGRLVSFTYDGKTLQGYEGEPVAAYPKRRARSRFPAAP